MFLLFSELKEYLTNEVCTKKVTSNFISNASLPLFLIIFLGMFIIKIFMDYTTPNIDGQLVSNLLQSNDINEKINFLIQLETKPNNTSSDIFFIIGLLVLLLCMVSRESFAKFILYFYPNNLFLFGKEIDRYKKRLDLRSKLFWIIFMGILVSIVGSLLVWKIIPN